MLQSQTKKSHVSDYAENQSRFDINRITTREAMCKIYTKGRNQHSLPPTVLLLPSTEAIFKPGAKLRFELDSLHGKDFYPKNVAAIYTFVNLSVGDDQAVGGVR